MITRISLVLLSFTFVLSSFAQNKIPSKQIQIETTLLASPEMYRDGAKVLGYDEDGELITLRDGDNGLICLADDPKLKGFSAACYSDKLEDFMRRGRELEAAGKSTAEKQATRKKEIDAGTLKMPEEPAIVYVLYASQEGYNPENGELTDSKIRYVFYKPYMTLEETGLPNKPQERGMPWLMDANTHRSHIMITP